MRGNREEGKRRNGRLSSRNRKRSGRKKAEKKGKMLKRRTERGKRQASTCGTAVGAKQGRTKGNRQKAKYTEPERRHGKPGRE